MFASLQQLENEKHNFFFFASAMGRMELSSSDMVKAWGEADLEENKSSVLEISFRCLLDNKANR